MRTGIRSPMIAVAIGFVLVVAGHAQTLETTIYLPDSAGGVIWPTAVVCNPNSNRFYVGGSYGGISVFGASNGAGITHFLAGNDDVQALCMNPTANKLYVAEGRDSGKVVVVDCATHSTLAEVPVGKHPRALLYHPVHNWVYCANSNDSTVTIIDCAGDTVLATVGVGAEPVALCYNPVNLQVYCANSGSNTVSVFGGAGARLSGSISVGKGPAALIYNPATNRIFCANGGDVFVSVIDGAHDWVVHEVPTGDEPRALCHDSIANTVFCANYNSSNVAVIDGEGNRVIAMMVVPEHPGALAFEAANGRVFCTSLDADSMTVLDGANNSVLGYIDIGFPQDGICSPAPDNHLAVVSRDASRLAVVDCRSSSVIATRPTGVWPDAMVLAPDGGKLYCASSSYYANGIMSVIDVQTRRVVANLPVGRHPRALCYNSQNHKVYCVNEDDKTVTIVDAIADTVLATVPVDGAEAICYAPAVNRVYAAAGYYAGAVTAIDCAGDTVVARFATLAGGSQLCTNVAGTRLYVAGEPAYVTVADCASDSIVADIPVGDNVGGLLCNSVSGKVYACEYVSGQVDIIDPATNSVTATVQAGNGSERMCYSLLDGNVFVDARSYSSIRVVDGAGDSIVASRTFPGYPNDVAYEPVYDRVYTAYFGGPYSTVVVMDASTYNTVGSVEVLGDPGLILANPADSTVYVTSADGAGIHVIGAAAGAVAEPHVTPLLAGPTAPAPTVIRGVLFLPMASGVEHSASSVLLDIGGRKVMDLVPGANDISRFAPGVYFVRGNTTGRTTKVMVVK